MTKRMRRGDEKAYAVFHELWFDRLFRYHTALTKGNDAMAKDATQETLCRVVRYIKVFDDETVFWCWLTRLARSSVADEGRKINRFQQVKRSILETDTTPDTVDDNDLLVALERGLGELSDSERKIIEGKYFHGNTVRELARDYNQTEKAVESRLSRIRNKIRKLLKTNQTTI